MSARDDLVEFIRRYSSGVGHVVALPGLLNAYRSEVLREAKDVLDHHEQILQDEDRTQYASGVRLAVFLLENMIYGKETKR